MPLHLLIELVMQSVEHEFSVYSAYTTELMQHAASGLQSRVLKAEVSKQQTLPKNLSRQ